MIYEVTCQHCGLHYRVTSRGGETRQVACPSCGHQTTVAFPTVERTTRKTTSETRKALWTMMIVLIIGLPLGGYAFYVYQQHLAEERAAFLRQRAERKAHVDSLNAIRAKQEAADQEALRQKARDDRSAHFLTQFYADTYFGETTPDTYRESITEHCYQKLLIDGNVAENQLGWSYLYPNLPDANKAEMQHNLRIQPRGDYWYDVVFRAAGVTQTVQLRVVPYQGQLLIDDYK